MNKIEVHYYDGLRYKPYLAILMPSSDGIVISYDAHRKYYRFADIEYIASVGDIFPALELPDEARIEFLQYEIPEWLNLKNKTILKHVNKIEKSWKWIGISFLAVLLVVFVIFRWGIPLSAYYITKTLPADTLFRVGNEAEKQIIEMTQPSELPATRQKQLTQLYQAKVKGQPTAKIIFRKGGDRLGANALAIPNNTIVLTDELVNLAQHDYEILAVLAHEQGHLHHRHSMQQAVQATGFAVIYAAATGDSTSIIPAIPVLLVQLHYSRDFELEADRYAIKTLQADQISPQYLADFLKRLNDFHHTDKQQRSAIGELVSTHPDTDERIQQVEKSMKP